MGFSQIFYTDLIACHSMPILIWCDPKIKDIHFFQLMIRMINQNSAKISDSSQARTMALRSKIPLSTKKDI